MISRLRCLTTICCTASSATPRILTCPILCAVRHLASRAASSNTAAVDKSDEQPTARRIGGSGGYEVAAFGLHQIRNFRSAKPTLMPDQTQHCLWLSKQNWPPG